MAKQIIQKYKAPKSTRSNGKVSNAPIETKKEDGKLQPFEIELKPPPMGKNPEVYKKVESIMSALSPGNAFIIPRVNRASVQKFLKDAYPYDKFAFYQVPGNDAVTRVYYVSTSKKK